MQALQDLVHTNLRILNTQCQGVLHTMLRRAPGYVCRWELRHTVGLANAGYMGGALVLANLACCPVVVCRSQI